MALLLASLLGHATDAVLQVATDDLTVLDANAPACDLLRVARADLLGRALPDLLGGGEAALRRAMGSVRDAGEAQASLAFGREGKPLDLALHAISLDSTRALLLLVEPGRGDRVASTARDAAALLGVAERACASALETLGAGDPASAPLREARGAVARAAALTRVLAGAGSAATPSERAEAPADRARPMASEAERPVVLFVDDEATLRSLGRRILEGNGFSVLEASTGADALDVARSADHINILVTDLSMPGMNGSELADRLTREHDQLGVLFLSGGGVHELEQVAAARRSFTFLEKPFAPSSLVHKLRELLSRAD